MSNVMIRFIDRESWGEEVGIGHACLVRPHLDWTIFRVGALIGSKASEKPKTGAVGFPGDGKTRMWIRREQIGWRFVEAVETGKWVREMPYISA